MSATRRTRHFAFRLLCVLLSTSIPSAVSGTGVLEVRIIDATTNASAESRFNVQVFEDYTRNISLAPNSIYEIECSYTASFDENNSWKKGGETIPSVASGSSPPSGVSVVSTNHIRTLVFNPFTVDHAGEYECFFPEGSRKLQIGVRNPTLVLQFVDLVFTENTIINDFRSHKPLQSGDIPPGAELQWFKDGVQQALQSGSLVLENYAQPNQAGEYTALLVDSNNDVLVTETMTITVNIKPIPELTVETSQVLVGDEIRLTCQDSTGVPTSTIAWSKDGTNIADVAPEGIVVSDISANHSELVISNSQLSHSGTYRCTASNVAGTISNEQMIEILLHPPSIPVLVADPAPLPSSLTYLAGSKLTLTCSVTVSSSEHHAEIVWKKGSAILVADERVSIVNANDSATTYTSTVTISGVSVASDAGSFVCEVTARNGTYYSLPVSSESVTVNVETPTLEVSMMASSNKLLDTEPYNQVIFNCSATAPDGILPDVIYEWFVDGQVLEQDQNGPIESHQNSLEILAGAEGSFVYTCKAKLELFGGDADVSASAEASIEVEGPEKPYVPVNVAAGSISYNSADIQFTVTEIRYTRETYHILYGVSDGQLTMRSEAIAGNFDLSVTNQVFTVRLLYLDHRTTYFYRVLAENENTDEATLTLTQTFTTPSLALLQVKAGSFRGCSNGQVLDGPAVSDFMSTTLASVVEESCGCDFPSSNLVNGTVLCSSVDSHDLVYRAYIVSTIELSSPQIISYIESWISEAPKVTSGVAIITFDPNCTTSIDSMLDPICNTTADSSEPVASSTLDLLGSDAIIVVVVVIALIIFLLLTVAILSITVYVLQRKIRLSAKRRLYASIKRDSGASSVNGWHGEAHVTNKCPVYTTAYNVTTHQEGIDLDHPRPPIPIPAPPLTDNTPGIYDSIDHLAQTEKLDLRERIAMARPPLPPGNPPEDCLSITSCNAYSTEENTGNSSAC